MPPVISVMKPSSSPMLLALLLVPWVWGLAAGRQAPGVVLRSRCDGAGCNAARATPEVSDGKSGLSSL